MVVSLNKREVLEFLQWNVSEWKFPTKDYFHIRSKDFPEKEILRVIRFLEVEGFKSENQDFTDFQKYLYDLNSGKWDLIIHAPSKVFTLQASDSGKSWPRVKLTPEEFKKMATCYNLDFVGLDELHLWLKSEKGIEFHTVMSSAPMPH